MKAVVAVERPMVPEDRMVRLESDVGELKVDVKRLESDVGELKVDVKRLESDVGELKVAVKRLDSDVGELKGDVKTLNARVAEWILASTKESGNLRAEMEKGFGALKTSIESAKLWMLVTGAGSVILVAFVTFLGRALKFF